MKLSLILAGLALSTAAAFSHPGKTDKSGGHVDSKTGKYHTHGKPDEKKKGEPAKKAPAKKASAAKKK